MTRNIQPAEDRDRPHTTITRQPNKARETDREREKKENGGDKDNDH